MIPDHPALRLVGICKRCHKPAHGYLCGGDGPFICFECAWGKQQPITTTSDRTQPTSWFYTFTTSNSTGSTSNNE